MQDDTEDKKKLMFQECFFWTNTTFFPAFLQLTLVRELFLTFGVFAVPFEGVPYYRTVCTWNSTI